ncbi:hypothetical protein [Lutibacter sp. B1]|uniref:hypothetical protein n=1 Tax=Lutibacter sp. B1 TaxID=2725996 RepID=UPI0014563876|nr:hypothetical protein [Lutibacter sp. B1]NLP58303.1 hypothetical protein [Lutibacter sp. B1]
MKTVDNNNFGKKVLKTVPYLQPYVKHRLYTAEILGVIPKNMYKSNGVIDDAIVQLYEEYKGDFNKGSSLKLELFTLVSNRLDEIFKKEEFHKKTLSISEILNNELEQLDEKFETDLDWDLLMVDELDDISYHQEDMKTPILLYNNAEENIIKSLEIYSEKDGLNQKNRMILNKIYSWLPFETSNLIDLYVFGNLNFNEIAQIKKVDVRDVESVIVKVQKSFRKNLN